MEYEVRENEEQVNENLWNKKVNENQWKESQWNKKVKESQWNKKVNESQWKEKQVNESLSKEKQVNEKLNIKLFFDTKKMILLLLILEFINICCFCVVVYNQRNYILKLILTLVFIYQLYIFTYIIIFLDKIMKVLEH